MWTTYTLSASSGYHAEFHEVHGTVGKWPGRGRAWDRHEHGIGLAWHVLINLIANNGQTRFQELETPWFQNNRQLTAVWFSSLGTGLLYPKQISLVLVSSRGRVDSKDIARQEESCE
jgi:hypothetical protein